VKLDYGDGIGVRTLTNQIGVKPDGARSAVFSAAGDTGAVLVNQAREVVGLLVAGTDTGYGVANPIADVLAALDVELYTGPARDKLRMPVRLSADVTGSTGANEEHLGLGDQPASESSDDPAPSANEDKDVFKEKQEKDERGELKNAKDFPIKEKEKEEGKDRKENADQDKFDADQKAKNEKDVLIEKPNNKDFFKREKGEFEGPVAGNAPVSLPFLDALEQRFAALEAEVGRQRHFIDRSLRPDLRHGALTSEPDVVPPPPDATGLTDPVPQGEPPKGGGDPG
jgi:cobalamin biosynthesis protein CobT